MNAGKWLTVGAFTALAVFGARGEFANVIGKEVVGYPVDKSTLTNFPVLVRIPSQQAQECRDDGADIKFTSSNEATVYPHEIDAWNPDGESTVWVKLPEMKNGTSFIMHWGDPDYTGPAEPQTKGAVWEDAGYVGVWHMTEESGNVANMTSFTGVDGASLDAVPAGALKANSVRHTENEAPIGYARFTGAKKSSDAKNSRAFLKVANYSNLELGAHFMVSGWYYMTEYSTSGSEYLRNARIFSRKTAWDSRGGFDTGLDGSSDVQAFMRGDDANKKAGFTGTPSANKKWVHAAFVFDGTNAKAYFNGSTVKTGTISAANDINLPLGIGSNVNSGENNDSYLAGSFDEVRLMRITSGASYADWVAAEYVMGTDKDFLADRFVSIDLPVLGEISDASVESHAAAIDWQLIRPGTSAADVRFAYGLEPGVYTVTNTLAEGLTTGFADTMELSNLHCGTTYHAQFIAENASGTVLSQPIVFTTTGTPKFAGVTLVVDDGKATASAVLSAPVETANVSASCWFARGDESPVELESWTVESSPAALSATKTDVPLGSYSTHFEVISTCSICHETLSVASEVVQARQAGECRWTGVAGDNCWNTAGNWSSGTVPTDWDTVVFGSEMSAALSGATISLGATQGAKSITVESAGELTFGTADDKSSGYALAAAHLVRTGEEAGRLVIATPFVFSAAADGTNTLVSAAAVRFNDSCGSATGGVLRKTGAAIVTLAGVLSGTGPAFLIEEGLVSAEAAGSLKASATVGGRETTARLAFTRDDVLAGSGVGTLSVLTNGTADIRKTNWGNFYSAFEVRDGGTINCNDYSYTLSARLKGGTVNCSGFIYASGYWQQNITSEASDITSWFKSGMTFSASDTSGSTAVITVNDGSAPVDLVITKSVVFGGGETSKVLEKKGNGTLRLLGTTGVNTTSPVKINAGTVLCDNVSGTPFGNASVRVFGGATLGGCGFIGGTARGDVTVDGSAGNPAVLAPGSVNEETGGLIYGTLTVGTEETANTVQIGSNGKVRFGFGRGKSDQSNLVVNGELAINEGATLELVSDVDELKDVCGGTYTIISATDGITGDFAEVVAPKKTWKVNKVVEGDVVKALTVTVPGQGLMVIIR